MSQQQNNWPVGGGSDYSSRTPTTTTTTWSSSTITLPTSGSRLATGSTVSNPTATITQSPTASSITIVEPPPPPKVAVNPQPVKRIVYPERPIAVAPIQQENSPPIQREILANNDPRSDDDLSPQGPGDRLHHSKGSISISISRSPSSSVTTPSVPYPEQVAVPATHGLVMPVEQPSDAVVPIYFPVTSGDQQRMVTTCCLVTVIIFVLICIMNIIMGSLHLGSCPASPGIPICLLGGSITCIFTFILFTVAEVKSWRINMLAFTITSAMLFTGIGIWFLLGSCAVFVIPRASIWCSYTIYLYTYIEFVIIYIILSFVFLFFLGSTFLMPESVLSNWISFIRWPNARITLTDGNGVRDSS